MDIQEKEVLIAEIERFKEEAMKSYVVSCWAESYTNYDPFGYVVLENKNNKVWWLKTQAYQLWEMWQAAKAQAVPEWISVEDKLPETEPNTDGVVCAVVCSVGNVYRARYMHDVDVGVDTKYWSEFSVGYNGVEHEHYEINAKITHWMPLPDAPQEPKG